MTPLNERPTPRTDAATRALGKNDFRQESDYLVYADFARLLEQRLGLAIETLEVADEALVWKHMPGGAVVQEHSADNITHPECNRCKAAADIRAALAELKGERG